MVHLPYAFSVHHFISTVGADAGFASIVGLAILVLLFFAQARETTTLRDQLAEAGERVQSLEARLSQALRGATPAPPPAGQPSPVGSPAAVRAAAIPAAASASPAPVGATAAAPASQAAPAAVAETPVGGAPAGVGAPAQGAATRLVPDITTVQPPVTAAATVAGAAGSGSRTATPTPAPAPVAANGSATPPAEPPPRLQLRPAGSPSPAARRPGAGSPLASSGRMGPSPRARRVLVAVLALAAIAAAVVVLLVVTGSGGSSSTSTTTTQASNAPAAHPRHRTATPSVVPSSVTVAVLNGTATNGLAHRVAVKLVGGGFRQGNITTAVEQTRTATTVAYLPGQRKAALAVAAALNLGSASVGPADQTTRTVACQGLSPAACSAQAVIVTVGADLANIR